MCFREEQLLNLFKNLVGIFSEFSMLLIAFIVAKFTDNGKSLFLMRSAVMMGLVVTIVLYFFVMILGTVLEFFVLEIYSRNLVPILTCVILFLGSLASVLALSIISSTIAFIATFLWICVFILLAYYYYQDLCLFMSTAAQTIKNFMY